MKLLGSSDGFSVRISTTREIDGRQFGKFCFLVGSHTIGNCELEIMIATAYNYVCSLQWNSGRRVNEKLIALDPQALFNQVDNVLYGDSSVTNITESSDEYGGLQVLCGECESMDNWKGYLVESVETARLIVLDPRNNLREFVLKVGEFDLTIQDAISYFESQLGMGLT